MFKLLCKFSQRNILLISQLSYSVSQRRAHSTVSLHCHDFHCQGPYLLRLSSVPTASCNSLGHWLSFAVAPRWSGANKEWIAAHAIEALARFNGKPPASWSFELTRLWQEHTLGAGSTPLSRTVELSVAAASPVFVAAADCDTVRCNRRYPLWPQLLSSSVAGSPVPV